MLIPVPTIEFSHFPLENKSPHHQCTYSDCEVTGSMFFDNKSENVIQINAHISFITSPALVMHQIHMDMMQSVYTQRNFVRFA